MESLEIRLIDMTHAMSKQEIDSRIAQLSEDGGGIENIKS